MPHDRSFVMPPAYTQDLTADNSHIERKIEVDVYAVLRDHLKYVEPIHIELRQSRHNQQELLMKVSELSTKVDELIGVATDLKSRVDAGPVAPVPGPIFTSPTEDDPQIEALANRIDDAIAVLKGAARVDPAPTPPADTSTVPPVNAFPDPNAPVPSEPDPNAPA